MIIKVRGPLFFSYLDEDAFFAWLKSISSVKDVTGSGRDIWIVLKRAHVAERDVRELRAVFRRYKAQFQTLGEPWQTRCYSTETHENAFSSVALHATHPIQPVRKRTPMAMRPIPPIRKYRFIEIFTN